MCIILGALMYVNKQSYFNRNKQVGNNENISYLSGISKLPKKFADVRELLIIYVGLVSKQLNLVHRQLPFDQLLSFFYCFTIYLFMTFWCETMKTIILRQGEGHQILLYFLSRSSIYSANIISKSCYHHYLTKIV